MTANVDAQNVLQLQVSINLTILTARPDNCKTRWPVVHGQLAPHADMMKASTILRQ